MKMTSGGAIHLFVAIMRIFVLIIGVGDIQHDETMESQVEVENRWAKKHEKKGNNRRNRRVVFVVPITCTVRLSRGKWTPSQFSKR